jgi:anti-sigma B factor antagonist
MSQVLELYILKAFPKNNVPYLGVFLRDSAVIMFLTIRFRQINFPNNLIASSAPTLTQLAESCERDKIEMVLLDLHQVAFIDSVGLGLLVSTQNKLRRKGIKFYVVAAQDQSSLLFELANVKQIFEIFQDYGEFYQEIAKNRFVLVHS